MQREENTDQSIEQLVRNYREHGISRGRFMAILAGLGASASGIATLLSSAEASAAGLPPHYKPAHHTPEQHKQLHHAHVQRQSGATVPSADASYAERLHAIMNDYADHAVVEDPLFSAPIVGKRAIAARKLAEMQSMRGVSIEVTNRFAHGDQVVAEWVLRGTHAGDIFGYTATGRQIEVRGVTVVTREHGKITRESLHYDVADLHRQLS